ncbi:SUR7 family protein pun1 [Aspergillus lentulus]|nr:SUR7 family protein pun1 [Aspergillus lentulus]
MRLQISRQAQSAKFLTINKQLHVKCTQLQWYRPKIESIKIEALITFSEVIYNEKYQGDLQKAFKYILDTCPFKQVRNLKPRLPSKSTWRRHRKKTSRANNTQKLHPITLC